MTKSPLAAFRIPRHIEHDGIVLRPLRIFDVPLIRKGLRDKDVLRTTGPGKPVSGGCLLVWWWLKKTYPILFCIEVASKCIGFIGLYNLIGESAEVTLVLLDNGNRRLGYGSRAYRAFVTNLPRSSFIKKFIVTVKADNYPSISFWKKLGFEELDSMNGIKTMALGLDENSP
ncbi:MAG: GNAT family N-acetyltransferase [Nitrospirae bacterium]|nr:GNAT family N-acetyltransferase [Nitrospirota bacterium]MCL5420935.1 GNAT family N-acetyltransferase [Nitrospirota bacterium]